MVDSLETWKTVHYSAIFAFPFQFPLDMKFRSKLVQVEICQSYCHNSAHFSEKDEVKLMYLLFTYHYVSILHL